MSPRKNWRLWTPQAIVAPLNFRMRMGCDGVCLPGRNHGDGNGVPPPKPGASRTGRARQRTSRASRDFCWCSGRCIEGDGGETNCFGRALHETAYGLVVDYIRSEGVDVADCVRWRFPTISQWQPMIDEAPRHLKGMKTMMSMRSCFQPVCRCHHSLPYRWRSHNRQTCTDSGYRNDMDDAESVETRHAYSGGGTLLSGIY